MEHSTKDLSIINEVESGLEDHSKMANLREVSMRVNFTDISATQSYVNNEMMNKQTKFLRSQKKLMSRRLLKHTHGYLRKKYCLILVYLNEYHFNIKDKTEMVFTITLALYLCQRLILIRGLYDEICKRNHDQNTKFQQFVSKLMKDEKDISIAARFLKQLPLQILDTYQRELKQQQTYEVDLFNYTESILSTQISQSIKYEDPNFFRKSASVLNINNYDDDQIQRGICLTHDIIGKHLRAFYRKTNSDIPEVLVYISQYFLDKKQKLMNSKILQKLDDQENAELDFLETQVTLGNYQYILTVSDSKIVMGYLKCILKCMEEPLCCYQNFQIFKKICENHNCTNRADDIVNQLKDLLHKQDKLYQETWKAILKILYELSKTCLYTKKQISQMFSDLLFKPPEFWSQDMITWRLFQELLSFMIQKCESIFNYEDNVYNTIVVEDVSIKTDKIVENYSLWDPDTQDKYQKSSIKLTNLYQSNQ
ncbi:rho gtpase-activating protein 1 [Stylonychia lemnae]|uniref:Rho gtpase-activating protein 1 n=1 Tax=Stylonychia lemnae TaxID=5949 RepID=A0A078AX74_STYLE|nr:rho gtpase-activating protein 1 [Stylonychia lemnae]|eukprot:CDW86671.1 rho gtpase-activating protein 1 [Stylonychia lemnae]